MRGSPLPSPSPPPPPLPLLALAALLATAPLASADEPEKPTPTATEANPSVPAPGHSIHGEAFNEGPRQAAHRMPGMGKVDFPATAAVPEAAAFINQGVAQLHSFYYLEAERSFRQAAQLDPGCPMAYWGMAMANVNNEKRARGFVARGVERAKDSSITPRERLYIDALAAFYKDKDDAKVRRQNLLLGLESIVQQFPDDLDARAWLAMVTWQNSGRGDGIGSRQAVDTLLESVLQVEPMHPGAHHYRIHLWDGVKPERALSAAALYGKAAPGIAHAWHMPGHTYTGLRRYGDAAYQQEASARVDHAAMLHERTMPFEIHNYAHNNQWLCTSLSHVGRVREAIAVARNLVEQPRDPQKNGPNDGGSAQREGRARWSEILVRYELWDDLIAATRSGDLDWLDVPSEQKQKAHTLGLALAAKGDREGLERQIDALRLMVPRGTTGDDDYRQPEDVFQDDGPPPVAGRPPAPPRPWPSCEAPWPCSTATRGPPSASSRSPIPCAPRRWLATIWPPATRRRPRRWPARPSIAPRTSSPPWRPTLRSSRPSARRRRLGRPTASSGPWPGTPMPTCRSRGGSRRSSPAGRATGRGGPRPPSPPPTTPPPTASTRRPSGP